MKKLLIIGVLALSVIITGCSNASSNAGINTTKVDIDREQTENEKSDISPSEDIQYIGIQNSFLDLSRSYDNYDLLISSSDNIVQGEVIEVDTFATYNAEMVSKIQIQVTSELKHNSISPGTTIEVLSSGGEIEYDEFVNSVDPEIVKKRGLDKDNYASGKIKETVNGLEQYQVGDTVLVFLHKIDGEDNYGIIGSYEGKFYIGQDGESIYRYKVCNSMEDYQNFKSQPLQKELESTLSNIKSNIK